MVAGPKIFQLPFQPCENKAPLYCERWGYVYELLVSHFFLLFFCIILFSPQFFLLFFSTSSSWYLLNLTWPLCFFFDTS